jgi:hypothetical protein
MYELKTRSDVLVPNITWFRKPQTKREMDLAAFRLFCLLSYTFVVLIMAGLI